MSKEKVSVILTFVFILSGLTFLALSQRIYKFFIVFIIFILIISIVTYFIEKNSKNIILRWIEEYENNLMGLVYFGAAFLIFVIGIRGMGSDLPDFIKVIMIDNGSERLSSAAIFISIFFEALLISAMALFNFFKEEEKVGKRLEKIIEILNGRNNDSPINLNEVFKKLSKEELEKLKEFELENVKIIDDYLRNF